MRRITAMYLMIFTLFFCLSGAARAEKENKYILISLQLKTNFNRKIVAVNTRFLVENGKEEILKIHGKRTERNDSSKEKKPFLTTVKVKPVIIKHDDPKLIKLNFTFLIDNDGTVIERNHEFKVIDGEKSSFETADDALGEEINMLYSATVYKKK